MKHQFLILVLLNSVWASIGVSQEAAKDLRALIETFKSFEYHRVIVLADSLLTNKEKIAPQQVIEIYRMKAIAHFTLSQIEAAQACFAAILEMDSTFALDTLQNSPKIVDFYQQVKAQFHAKRRESFPKISSQLPDTMRVKAKSPPPADFTNAMSRSLLLPGWGHRIYGRSTKGWLLSIAGLATAGASIYYVLDTQRKERDYLNETRHDKIEEKYERYNSSYRLRNIFVASYLAVWVYSQVDLFSLAQKNNNSRQTAITPLLYDPWFHAAMGMKLTLHLPPD